MNVLGAKIRLATGYKDGPDAYLAMQRGEVNGVCYLAVSVIRRRRMADVAEGRLKLVIQMGPTRTGEFGNVPDAFDYAKTDEARRVLEFYFNRDLLGRALAGPPGMPTGRLAALRQAFQDTMKDREFLADARKANLDIAPATGEQLEQLLVQFANYPKAVMEKAKSAIGR